MTEDDARVPDETDLLRRVHPEQVIWDENVGVLRPTSAAFRDVEMSVNLGDDIEREGLTSEFAVRNHPRHHLAALTALAARAEEQDVRRTPRADDPTHGDVVGAKPKPRRTVFALGARWEILRQAELSDELRARLLAEADGNEQAAG